MGTRSQNSSFVNDLFISYSRKDLDFARAIEKALKNYFPPKALSVPKRRLVVFRDEADFTGVEYNQSLRRHLENSKKMLVICSPNARASKFVNEEIQLFTAIRGVENIIPVLLSGIPNNKAITNEQIEKKAFPQSLTEIMPMPLAVNFLDVELSKFKVNKGSYEGSWYTVLANIYSVSRRDVEQRERKRKNHQLRIRTTIVVGIIFVLSIMLIVALVQRKKAIQAQAETKEQLRKYYWSNALDSKAKDDWQRFLQYGARSAEVTIDQPNSKNAIYSVTKHMSIILNGIMQHESAVKNAVFNKDETKILTWSEDRTARLWDASDGSAIGQPMKHDDAIKLAIFDEEETRILTWSDNHKSAFFWDAADGSLIRQPVKKKGKSSSTFPNRDGSRVLTWEFAGMPSLWDGIEGTPIWVPGDYSSLTRAKGGAFSYDGSQVLTWEFMGRSPTLWNIASRSYIRLPFECEGSVFDKEGKRVLIWNHKGTVQLWDTTDGSSIGQPMKHMGAINGAVFNKDETKILTWGRDGIALWDATTCSLIGQPMKQERLFEGPVFNHDETRILTWSSSSSGKGKGEVNLWDANNGTLIRQLIKHGSIGGATFSKTGSRIVIWGRSGTNQLWDIANFESIDLPTFQHNLGGLTLNEDGTRILTWDNAGAVKLWTIRGGFSVKNSINNERKINGAIFSSAGTRILTWSGSLFGTGEGAAKLWDATDGSSLGKPMRHKRPVNGAMFNKDDTRILTWSVDGSAKLWDAEKGSPVGRPMMHEYPVRGAVFNDEQTEILTWSGTLFGAKKGEVMLWDASNGSPIGKPMRHDSWVDGATFDKNETQILTWSGDRKARLWDAKHGSLIGTMFHNGYGLIKKASFNKNGTRILTLSDDHAQLWDATDCSIISLPNNPARFYAAFNQEGTQLLTWSADGAARLWDAIDCSLIGVTKKHLKSVRDAMFDNSGTRFLTLDHDGIAMLWDTTDCSLIGLPMKFGIYTENKSFPMFSNDGTRILTRGIGGIARLWTSANGQISGLPMDSIYGAIFNRDDTRILTWSVLNQVRLWDAADGSPLGLPIKHGLLQSAVFNKDETRILTFSTFLESGKACLWNIEADEDFPKEHMSLLVKVAIGTSIDEYGNIINLSKNEWEKYKAEYIIIAEEHLRLSKRLDNLSYSNLNKIQTFFIDA